MKQRALRWCRPLLLACLLVGCAAHFSPGTVRQEIVRQRGQDPLSVSEFNIGRFTTLLVRRALVTEGGALPFAGVRELQLAVYEVRPAQGPAIDVTRIGTGGWEPVVRVHDNVRSAMVLIRGTRTSSWGTSDATATIGDLVVIGAGQRTVVYARLCGSLSADLPSALGEVVRRGGPDEIRRTLMELGEHPSGTD